MNDRATAKYAAEAYARSLLHHCVKWGLLFDYRNGEEGEDAANLSACVRAFVEKCAAHVDLDREGRIAKFYLSFPDVPR